MMRQRGFALLSGALCIALGVVETASAQAASQRASAPACDSSDRAVADAPPGVWTYVEFPDTTCRDGTKAGIAVRKSHHAKELMVYLEGGGICFDELTCEQNPANTADQRAEQTGGVFDTTNPDNPVRDWNIVYVPYCTGDLHAGDRVNVEVPNVGVQQFQGAKNLHRFLLAITAAFPAQRRVLLSGASAGGYGAEFSLPQVQRAFPRVVVHMISDSGPLLGKAAVATCLQDEWRTLFGYDRTVLAECGGECPHKSDYFLDYARHLARHYGPSGLIETVADVAITDYLGIGTHECTGALDQTPLDPALFEQALLSYRTALERFRNVSTYLIEGSQHTWMEDSTFYGAPAGGVPLYQWFGDVATRRSTAEVGP